MRNSWRTYKGEEITQKITKGSSPRWQGFEYQKQGVLFVTSENVRDGYLDISRPKFLAREFAEKTKGSALKPDDILINIVGASIGRVCQFKRRDVEANVNQAVCVFRLKSGFLSEFFLYYFQSPHVQYKLLGKTSDTARPNLSLSDFREFEFHVPPLPEQRRIAEILRSWDEAVEKLGSLQDTKKAQYKAFARKFFDPCHPSFDGRPYSWREFELGDLFQERDEAGADDDRLLSITMSEGVIDRQDVGRKDTSTEDKSAYRLILPGDIGYNTMRMWQGVCGLSALRGIVSPAYTVVIPDNENIEARYAAHLFKSRRMVFDFERYSQGLTSDTWNLKFPAFSRIKLFLPPITLQRKQAALLDAMKVEINALGHQRDALARQKRGLMQKLLTGKWRVKVDGKKEVSG